MGYDRACAKPDLELQGSVPAKTNHGALMAMTRPLLEASKYTIAHTRVGQ